MISVIVPLYNEGERVVRLVAHLRAIAGLGEVVLVEASDAPCSLAVIDALDNTLRAQADHRPLVRMVRCATPGRAVQMNLGARQCGGSVLLFLHCDTRLPPTAAAHIAQRMARGHLWGWFDLRLDAPGAAYRLLERAISRRARMGRIATGDQAMFIQRRAFVRLRGFAEIPLMEDVEMSRRLRRLGRPRPISQPVVTSARRWQQNGLLRTVLLMWKLRLLFWLGHDPARLAARYRDVR